ncbi:hypothetical protein GE115_02690 [Agromyces sp. CFH 90414]|uniref:Uncharacterized protein n=1 Tax=Agromyces agglutinans TaxID=2662258 RepID=A0A6I2F322_9MICO|nr:hypothetical protein [Agromyces agglutinans]MRG58784.1 hypothetical protein [Agromyces agglutinans]
MNRRVDRSYAAGPTVLDVVETALGAKPKRAELERLTISELEELRDLLSQLWEAQYDQPAGEDAYLVGGWLGAFWSAGSLRAELSDSLLYYPRLLVLDPLADFFAEASLLPPSRGIRYRRRDGQYNTVMTGASEWSQWSSFARLRETPELAASQFAAIVSNLFEVEHLIRSGVVVVRSQWPTLRQRAHQLATSVRHDIRSSEMQAFARSVSASGAPLQVWDNLRGGAVEMQLPVHRADEPWQSEPAFYYLSKTLAIADESSAQYVPATEQDLDLLRLKVRTALPSMHPAKFLREVSRVIVPSVDVPIERAIEIRESSENFDDWRRSLRKLRRAVSADTEDDLTEQVQDELRPRVRAVERELKGGSASVREDGAAIVIDGMIGLGVGLAVGAAAQDTFAGIAAGSLSGAVQWIRRAYTREKPGGADAVLATLIKRPYR